MFCWLWDRNERTCTPEKQMHVAEVLELHRDNWLSTVIVKARAAFPFILNNSALVAALRSFVTKTCRDV